MQSLRRQELIRHDGFGNLRPLLAVTPDFVPTEIGRAEAGRDLQAVRRAITFEFVDAMFLGVCRKADSWLNGGPSDPIHIMSNFEALIAERHAKPLPAGYSAYLRNQLQRPLKAGRSKNK